MPKTAIHISFLFFLLTALTGIFMRFLLLTPQTSMIPFSFLLHGHSHSAILGWAFLGVFLIFLKIVWHELHSKKQAMWIISTTFIITVCMFIAFLFQGYATYSIIFSTIHIGIEYWMIVYMFRTMKQLNNIPSQSKLFIKGALISLIISTIGPFALGGLGMTGLKDSPFFDMAIYFFLHFQYNGWLFLMLIGTLIMILARHHITLSTKWLNSSFWIYMITLFPAYILSILWYGFGNAGTVLGLVGVIGQFIGITLFVLALLQKVSLLRQKLSQHIRLSLVFVFLLLLSKALMEFGLLYQPFASLIFDTRAVVVGYLHLTLLGFISIFILTQFQMTALLNEHHKAVLYGIAIFIVGFAVNEIILFIQGLGDWVGFHVVFGNELLLIASIILLVGIATIWSSLHSDQRNH